VSRDYQYDFSINSPPIRDTGNLNRKTCTRSAVLPDYLSEPLAHYDLLNVGSSAGIFYNYLSPHFYTVVGIDSDEPAISHEQATYQRGNLEFRLADELNLPIEDNSFDVVVCFQVYEHAPDRIEC